jgi:hypothetical protein
MIKNAGISGGLAPRENPEQMPTMFVAVESINEYINKAQQLGAKVIKNKQEISLGYYAVMEDPQKNTFGIWQGKNRLIILSYCSPLFSGKSDLFSNALFVIQGQKPLLKLHWVFPVPLPMNKAISNQYLIYSEMEPLSPVI